MKLSCILLASAVAIGNNYENEAKCAATVCTYSNGRTLVSTSRGAGENWHCEKTVAGCECVCHASYKCTIRHHHTTGYKKSFDHCKAKATPAPTNSPTASPTPYPTTYPTPNPTAHPTAYPTPHPTAYPTPHPTAYPTPHPTAYPTPHPTAYPTPHPTAYPTPHPTAQPTKGEAVGLELCAGQTTTGQWKKYGNSGIYVDVDTSACGLTQAHPAYVTGVYGTSSHWTAVGTSAVYSATKTGFRLYLGNCGGASCQSRAVSYGWKVNWVADKTGKSSGCGSSSAWKKYSNSGLYTDTSTASAGFTSTPRYVTSIHGTSSHWTLRGPHTLYSVTKTGFRTYVYGQNNVNSAKSWGWQMCWIGSTNNNYSSQQTNSWSAYGGNAVVDTSISNIKTFSGYTNIYVTSLKGPTSHWTTHGAGSMYPNGNNVRNYISGQSAAFLNQHGHKMSVVVGYYKKYTCTTSKNWVNSQRYSQTSLTDYCRNGVCNANPKYGGANNKDKAIGYCQKTCNERNGCTGFFFQTHNNGHEICGFYSSAVNMGNAQWHGHKNGAVCHL